MGIIAPFALLLALASIIEARTNRHLSPSHVRASVRSDPQAASAAPSSVPLRLLATGPTFVEHGYIVELESSAKPFSLGTRSGSQNVHEALYSHLDKRGVSYKIRHIFDDSEGVFYGVSVQLSNEQDLGHFASCPGVKTINRISKFYRGSATANVKAKASNQFAGATLKLLQALPNKLDTASQAMYTYGPHVQTGVDKLLSSGLTGQGVQIAFIDSGIDYRNPLLGGCFGSTCRVAKGYDLVGSNFTATGIPLPGPDPFADCSVGAHGTFVAGVAAGTSNPSIGWSGVAPGATIAMYKVSDCESATTDSDILMAAMMRAAQDGADIISISYTQQAGFAADPFSVFAQNLIAKTGVMITSSVGNDGEAGLFFPFAPATAPSVFKMGGLRQPATIQFNVTTNTKYPPITFYGSHYFNFSNLPVYFPADNPTGCSEFPTETPDLSNRVILMARGSCFYYVKAMNAAAFNATRILIYNGATQPFSPPADTTYDDLTENGFNTGNIGVISYADGQYLVQQAATNPTFRLSSTNPHLVQAPAPSSGLIDPESGGIGPTYDMYPSISLLAPDREMGSPQIIHVAIWRAVFMLSTYPITLGSMHVEGGTSFSAPYMAGALALYIQAKQLRRPYNTAAIMGAFVWTATPTHNSYGLPGLDLVAAQGGGLINAYNAVSMSESNVSPSIFNLNDTAYFAGVQNIKFTNSGILPKVYSFSHQPTISVYTNDPGSIYPSTWPMNNYSTNAASVTFSVKGKLVVLPFTSANVKIQFAPPQGLDATRFPLYSGFINIKSVDGELYSIPYQGIAAAMKDLQIVDTGDRINGISLPVIVDGDYNPQSSAATYTFQENSYPQLAVRLTGGTPLFTVLITNSNFTLPSASSQNDSTLALSSVPGIIGEWPGFTFDWVGRSVADASTCSDLCTVTDIVPWSGNVQTSDGTIEDLPNGGYKVAVLAQKITGDANKWYDYEAWLSPEINISR